MPNRPYRSRGSLAFPAELSIRAKDLEFTYPGSQTPALKEIDFELLEGKTIAIVGPSGSGKTTLGNLLLRILGGISRGDNCR